MHDEFDELVATLRPDARVRAGHPRARLARLLMGQLFRLVIPRRRWRPPAAIAAKGFRTVADDGVSLTGWYTRPDDARGTVVILHGMMRDCTMDGIPDWAARFARQRFAVAAVDLRGHGRSDHAVPSFGVAEGRDVRATLDACDRLALPRPFTLIGASLGALAAQCAAVDDARVDAAALLAMPGSPRHGVRTGARAIAGLACEELKRRASRPVAAVLGAVISALALAARPIARLIERAHGLPVLDLGDVRHRTLPDRRPLILAAIGSRDPYDWRATARAWRHWSTNGARPFATPSEAPAQDSWLVIAPDVGHPPDPPHLIEWPGLWPLLSAFLELVVARRTPGRAPRAALVP